MQPATSRTQPNRRTHMLIVRHCCVAAALLGVAAAGTLAAPTEITVGTKVTNPHVNRRWMARPAANPRLGLC